MARAHFKKGEQKEFLEKVIQKSRYAIKELADRCGVSLRTFNDWRREKYHANYERVKYLSGEFDVPLVGVKKLSDYWYVSDGASMGGRARIKLHGPTWTTKGRIIGGTTSQLRRRENPEKYRRLGCVVRKKFKLPRYSEDFAEIIGIILGDGAINNYQVRISLDRKVDRDYALFVSRLAEKIFGEKPSWSERLASNTIELTISGIGLVEMLESVGLKRGNKIVHQVDFPEWIHKKPIYENACVRGLFDTDGGLYFHKKRIKRYLGWCFASSSAPLLKSVEDVLINLGFNVKKSLGTKLYMYDLRHIERYLKVVGSSNPKNVAKLKIRLE